MTTSTRQRIVVVVGPDMVGKTTLIKYLSTALGIPSFKASSEHSSFLSDKQERFIGDLRFADPRVIDLLKQTGHSVIFDRGFPCEFAYSSYFNRSTDLAALAHVDRLWADAGTIIVHCTRNSFEGLVDDLNPRLDACALKKIDEHYCRFQNSSRCSWITVPLDDPYLLRDQQKKLFDEARVTQEIIEKIEVIESFRSLSRKV